MSMFGSVKGKAQQAQFEANKLLRINQTHREINQIKRQVQQTKYGLGNAAYDMFLKKELEDESLLSICDELQKLETEIATKEQEIEEIRGEEIFIDETVATESASTRDRSLYVKGALPNGHRVASPAAVLAILFFFMPWVFASCGTRPLGAFSGWDIATGIKIDTGFGAQRYPGSPIIILVLFVALIVLGLAYFAWQRGRSNKLDSYGLIGLGLVTLVLIYLISSMAKKDAASEGLLFEFMYGLWGTVISYIGIVIGGIMNLRQPASSGLLPSEPDLPFQE